MFSTTLRKLRAARLALLLTLFFACSGEAAPILYIVRIPLVLGEEAQAVLPDGKTIPLGKVAALPTSSRWPGYTASKWAPPGSGPPLLGYLYGMSGPELLMLPQRERLGPIRTKILLNRLPSVADNDRELLHTPLGGCHAPPERVEDIIEHRLVQNRKQDFRKIAFHPGPLSGGKHQRPGDTTRSGHVNQHLYIEFPTTQKKGIRFRPPLPTVHGWGGWIRTSDGGSKVRCLAAWLHPILNNLNIVTESELVSRLTKLHQMSSRCVFPVEGG